MDNQLLELVAVRGGQLFSAPVLLHRIVEYPGIDLFQHHQGGSTVEHHHEGRHWTISTPHHPYRLIHSFAFPPPPPSSCEHHRGERVAMDHLQPIHPLIAHGGLLPASHWVAAPRAYRESFW